MLPYMTHMTPQRVAEKERRIKVALTAVCLTVRDMQPNMTADDILGLIQRVTGEDEITTFLAVMLFNDLLKKEAGP